MKTEMESRFEFMEKVIEDTNEDFKNEMALKIKVMDETVEDFKKEMGEGIKDEKQEMGREISDIKKEVNKLKGKCESLQKYGVVKSDEYHPSSAKIKAPTYDGKTSWQTYKKQFDAAANVNNWSDSEKATALIVSLRGDALEVLQTLSEDKRKD